MVFLPPQPPPTTNPELQGKTPWYTFPRIDNFGQIDPQGPYWKPDSNILTPPGYPITNLLPGTVSSVQRTSWGQSVVTVRLDNPLNKAATHTVYQHMHDATVTQGQRVDAGTVIGHANYTGEGANLGFGLYGGDIYGSGPAWDTLQADLKPGGAGLLNPTNLLDQAKKGNLNTNSPGGLLSSYNAPVTSNCGLLDISCWASSIGEHIAIFVLGLVLIIVGLLLIGFKPVEEAAQKAGKAAMLA
jgi:murein DD-endopeptidase MepM/ murein hydrolase activator NlpD